MRAALLTLCLVLAGPLRAGDALPDDPAAARFVTANMVSALYHEVAHALLAAETPRPAAAREEAAADAFAVLMFDRLSPPARAEALVRDATLAFLLYSAEAGPGGGDPFYRGAHGLDRDRSVALLCLFYGADPAARAGLAEDFALPASRRATCPAEHRAAAAAWQARLAGLAPQDHAPALRLAVPAGRDALTRAIATEIAAVNGEISLPQPVDVTVEHCGEASAFYDPRARRIVLCTDYAADLARLFARAAGQADGADAITPTSP